MSRQCRVRRHESVGPKGMEKLFKETIAAAQRENLLRRSDVSRAIVETTVQEKAIEFPTDAQLYHKARRTLVRAAKREGILLRQSYELLGKKMFLRHSRYAHARQGKRAMRETRKIKTFLGRVIRDLQRKSPTPSLRLASLLSTTQRIFFQKRGDSPKIYSAHAPETECIAKGKAHKKYEFCCKVSVVSTARKNCVIGIGALHGNPYDGPILIDAIEQAQKLTGWKIEDALVDRGYRSAAKDLPEMRVHQSWRKNPAIHGSQMDPAVQTAPQSSRQTSYAARSVGPGTCYLHALIFLHSAIISNALLSETSSKSGLPHVPKLTLTNRLSPGLRFIEKYFCFLYITASTLRFPGFAI